MPRGRARSRSTELPPDTPLEPGSGVPRVGPGSAAARIAASEAALGKRRPAIAETGGKSASIAAARNAAKASYLDTPVKVPKRRRAKPGVVNGRSRSAKDAPEPQFRRTSRAGPSPAAPIPPQPEPMPPPMPPRRIAGHRCRAARGS